MMCKLLLSIWEQRNKIFMKILPKLPATANSMDPCKLFPDSVIVMVFLNAEVAVFSLYSNFLATNFIFLSLILMNPKDNINILKCKI